jgi:hypothetical protein
MVMFGRAFLAWFLYPVHRDQACDESVPARINIDRADQKTNSGTRVTEVDELSRAAEDDPRGHGAPTSSTW